MVVTRYDFSKPSKFAKNHIAGFRNIYEYFCKTASIIFETLMRSEVIVDIQNIKEMPYEGYIKTSPFKCKLHLDKVEHHPLTVGQIQLIQNKEITNERLAKVRDLFIFQCYTGLAYCDMATLTKDNIIDGYIIKTRKRFGK